MSERNLYTAVCEREGGWWSISINELPGVFTQARRLDQVEELVRDAIALWLEVPATSFDIVLEPHLSGSLDEFVARTLEARQEAERWAGEAAQLTRAAADELAHKDLSLRDIGTILGVSHQRVKQLLDS